jgi:hypothetical protein
MAPQIATDSEVKLTEEEAAKLWEAAYRWFEPMINVEQEMSIFNEPVLNLYREILWG